MQQTPDYQNAMQLYDAVKTKTYARDLARLVSNLRRTNQQTKKGQIQNMDPHGKEVIKQKCSQKSQGSLPKY